MQQFEKLSPIKDSGFKNLTVFQAVGIESPRPGALFKKEVSHDETNLTSVSAPVAVLKHDGKRRGRVPASLLRPNRH